MHRGFVHLVNVGWLALVLVGVPAVTSLQWGNIRLTSNPEFQMLTLGGLLIGALFNGCGFVVARSSPRKTYCTWIFVFGALLGVQWAFFAGHLQFDWLKEWLLRFSRR